MAKCQLLYSSFFAQPLAPAWTIWGQFLAHQEAAHVTFRGLSLVIAFFFFCCCDEAAMRSKAVETGLASPW